MSQIIIDTGNVADDGTGSTLRQAFTDVNTMFTQVYTAGPVGSNVQIANNQIVTTVINQDLVIAPSGIGNLQANARVVPGVDDVYDLGSPTKRWNTIYVGTGGLDIKGGLNFSGNVTANYFIGNGSQLTGIVAKASHEIANGTSNINIAAANGNITVSVNGTNNVATFTQSAFYANTNIVANGNVTGNYILGNGALLTGLAGGTRIVSGNSNVTVESANGDITIGVHGVSNVAVFTPTNIQLKGNVDILGTIVAPGLDFESGNLAVIGNITAQYYVGNGRYLTGVAATAAQQIANGISSVNIPTASGNIVVSVGNVSNVATFTTTGQNLTGSLSASGNVTANVITANTFVGNIQGNIQAPGSNTQVLFNDNNTTNAVAGFTFNKTSNTVSVSGNITSSSTFTGNGVGLTSTLVDSGNDPNNWNTNLKMGVYTVNRTSWSGTTGAPLDSQVYKGILEVINSTNLSASQVFYPGSVTAGDVIMQWNRNYFNGVWTGWVKIINDDQVVHGGDF
jgi:hypothetical protein